MSDNSKNHNVQEPTIEAARINARGVIIAAGIAAIIGLAGIIYGQSTVVIQDSLPYLEITQQLAEAKSENGQLHTQNENLTLSEQELNSTVKEQQRIIEQLQLENESLKSDASSFNSSDVMKENQRLQSECERLNAYVAELEKRVPPSVSTAGKTPISSLRVMEDHLGRSNDGLKDSLGRDYSDAQTYIRVTYGSIEYLLDGQYTTLEGCYAAGDGYYNKGTSTISISLEDNNGHETLVKTITIDYKTEKSTFTLDLKQAKYMKIVVVHQYMGDDCLLVDWVVS